MKWERTFEFSAPVAKVWQAFTDRECQWRVFDAEDAYRSGGAITIDVTEQTTNQSMSWTETGGEDRWEMAVTFSETQSGTSVTIVRSGFGDGDEWLAAGVGRLLGWEHALADIEVFFRTGRAPSTLLRHALDDDRDTRGQRRRWDARPRRRTRVARRSCWGTARRHRPARAGYARLQRSGVLAHGADRQNARRGRGFRARP